MTQRVGIDIVEVAAVAAALDAHGNAYLDHVYTPAEQADCARGADRPRPALLAQRFAVKEATRKVVDAGLRWTQVEVGPGPQVSVPEPGWRLSVSMTETGGRAAAIVIGERE